VKPVTLERYTDKGIVPHPDISVKPNTGSCSLPEVNKANVRDIDEPSTACLVEPRPHAADSREYGTNICACR
jgi:hypothetical protein